MRHIRRHMIRRRHMAGLVLLLGLAACSGGTEAPTLNQQVIAAGRAAITARTAPRAAAPELTPALLDTVLGSFLEVTRETTGQTAFLYVETQRRDAGPGLITVWRTVDEITLSTRNGVLIATRGFGGDILSGGVRVSGDQPGPAGSGARVLYIRALDNKRRRLALACEQSDLGPETIEIVERRHATRRIQERCTDAGGGVVLNDYWVDSRAGLVWKSRQWAGPDVGYLRLRRLTD
jgi:group 4 capsule polysaccharide lipoprotein GfcB/YjbF